MLSIKQNLGLFHLRSWGEAKWKIKEKYVGGGRQKKLKYVAVVDKFFHSALPPPSGSQME